MPSTYSPDLRIELIANGEKSGTWGTITNDNLGVIIEDAISGLAPVLVTSANQPLTAQNGAVDQARCAAVSLTTTTTAPFNVYVPPVTKLYVIINASGYTATIYCSTVLGNTTAAGTGVAVPTGKSVLLRADGSNVVEQLNYLVGSFATGGSLTVDDSGSVAGSLTVGGDVTLRGAVDSREPIAAYGSALFNVTAAQTVAQASAIDTSNDTISIAAPVFTNGVPVMLSTTETMPGNLSENTVYYTAAANKTRYYTAVGSISGTLLTITSIQAGAIGVGSTVTGTGVAAGTTVSSLGSGVGGIGTYNLNTSQTLASTRISGEFTSGTQLIKLSTSSGGSAVNISSTGTGNLTITPVVLANTPPVGSTTNAVATTAFVTNSVIPNQVLKNVKAATTSSITLSGTQTIDGVALVAGDRVLVKDQLTSAQTASFNTSTDVVTVTTAPSNGSQIMFTTTGTLPTGLVAGRIYYVINSSGATFKVAQMQDGPAIDLSGTPTGTNTVGTVPAATNGIYEVDASTWTRASDADTAAELAGAQVSVLSGTVNGGRQFATNFKSTNTLGSTAMQWTQVIDGPATATTLGGLRAVVSGTTLNLYTYE